LHIHELQLPVVKGTPEIQLTQGLYFDGFLSHILAHRYPSFARITAYNATSATTNVQYTPQIGQHSKSTSQISTTAISSKKSLTVIETTSAILDILFLDTVVSQMRFEPFS
jgi:hypothetical protein